MVVRRCTAILWGGLAILGALAISCSDDKSVSKPPEGRLFDFTLTDINPNSSTYRQPVTITSFQGHPLVLYAGSAG